MITMKKSGGLLMMGSGGSDLFKNTPQRQALSSRQSDH
ncbi:hypothetical protein BN133_2978 [Cronobacter dublinensis 582]|nr:hypothetical protein BN133_2978 [Cronobacter dublinensis 582]